MKRAPLTEPKTSRHNRRSREVTVASAQTRRTLACRPIGLGERSGWTFEPLERRPSSYRLSQIFKPLDVLQIEALQRFSLPEHCQILVDDLLEAKT